MAISELVEDHNSHPYNRIDMQKEEYSLNDVEGCKQPNLEPTVFNAKKHFCQMNSDNYMCILMRKWHSTIIFSTATRQGKDL